MVLLIQFLKLLLEINCFMCWLFLRSGMCSVNKLLHLDDG